MSLWFIACFVLLTIVTTCSRGDNCPDLSTADSDVDVRNYTFRRIDTSSVYDCAFECMTSSLCESFGFDTRSRNCYLTSKSGQHVDTVRHRSDFLFSDIARWKEFLGGPCASVTCSASSRCQLLRNGQTRYVSEFHGCGFPKAVPDADVAFNGVFLDAVAHYSCKPDFLFCRAGKGSRCQASGEWTDISQLCKRFRWRNPKVKFVEELPCKLEENHLVRIKATPTKEKVMIFNLIRGSDLLMHVSCRFTWYERRDYTVFNSYLNGRFGQEFTTKDFPFVVNRSFLMEMSYRKEVYKIWVDGQHHWSFKERIPGAIPNKLYIGGTIRVDTVEIII